MNDFDYYNQLLLTLTEEEVSWATVMEVPIGGFFIIDNFTYSSAQFVVACRVSNEFIETSERASFNIHSYGMHQLRVRLFPTSKGETKEIDS